MIAHKLMNHSAGIALAAVRFVRKNRLHPGDGAGTLHRRHSDGLAVQETDQEMKIGASQAAMYHVHCPPVVGLLNHGQQLGQWRSYTLDSQLGVGGDARRPMVNIELDCLLPKPEACRQERKAKSAAVSLLREVVHPGRKSPSSVEVLHIGNRRCGIPRVQDARMVPVVRVRDFGRVVQEAIVALFHVGESTRENDLALDDVLDQAHVVIMQFVDKESNRSEARIPLSFINIYGD
ncbi:MAG: hypothetical protein MUP47_06775 [Phycisphaerae bacterium]|nr:hypothetical protein [Phycisphaerae bacterium]